MRYITISGKGRLGNKLGEYATLIAFARKFTLQPIVSHKMKKVLRKVFDHLPSEQFGFRETIQLESTQHE